MIDNNETENKLNHFHDNDDMVRTRELVEKLMKKLNLVHPSVAIAQFRKDNSPMINNEDVADAPLYPSESKIQLSQMKNRYKKNNKEKQQYEGTCKQTI